MVMKLLEKYVKFGNVFRRLNREELLKIPLPYRSTVMHWQNEENLLDVVRSERVLSEHKAYLRNLGINLDGQPPTHVSKHMSLREILEPVNFIPVPDSVRRNPALFYEIDMRKVRSTLKKKAGGGIGSLLLDPYRVKTEDMVIEVESEDGSTERIVI